MALSAHNLLDFEPIIQYNWLMRYNWQQPDWPNFHYDVAGIQDLLFMLAEKVGRVEGALSGLSDEMQKEVILNLTVMEAVKTSEIEGEYISPANDNWKRLGSGTTL